MKGYAKIASLMGKHPEMAMVRQFGALSVQNILYLQAELVALEYDFRKLEAANDAHQDGRGSFSLDWDALMSADKADGSDAQWKTALLIRAKLKEYSGHGT
jgi:hypothetical protein